MEKLNALRHLNFGELIGLAEIDPANYTFSDYRQRGFCHPKQRSFCISCEEKGIHTATDDPSYQLCNMSHGAHTEDFLDALPSRPDTSEWQRQPVLFVFETPSLDYGIYETREYCGFEKRPAKEWYWVHDDQESATYPEHFKGGTYGELILSMILTFRLANAYVTNLVKCGLNLPSGDGFKPLDRFQDACVENCCQKFLEREIEILEPRVAFVFGGRPADWLRRLLPETTSLQRLPHPAMRGLRGEYFKVLYFWLIVRALHTAGMTSTSDAKTFAETFLRDFD